MSSAHILRISLLWMLISGFIISAYFFILFLLKPTTFCILGDSRLSATSKIFIEQFIIENYTKLSEQRDNAFLNQQVPFITLTQVQLRPIKKAVIKYHVSGPVALVVSDQDKKVLTHDGLFVDYAHYAPEFLEQLVVIKVQSKTYNQESHELLTWIQKIPLDIIENFSIIWCDKTRILLKPISDNRFTLLVTHLSKLTPLVLTKVQEIMMNRRSKKEHWIIDARFKDYLMLKRG